MKAFEGRGFCLYGILNDFPIELEGKTIAIDVEVVDAQLYYNLLLGQSYTYAMATVVSSYFRMIMFLQEGRIVKGSYLIGTFVFPPPVLLRNEAQINMITSSTFEMGYPWKVPSE